MSIQPFYFVVTADSDIEAGNKARLLGEHQAPVGWKLSYVHVVVDKSDATIWHVDAFYEPKGQG